MHAVEFLKSAPDPIPSVVVLAGAQRHLKHSAISLLKKLIIDDDDNSFTRFAGSDAQLSTVSDELRTVSMWGDRRLVLVENADPFVTACRAQLEKLVENPPKKSVLVLDVDSWPKTTRLAKQVAAKGLDVDCSDLKGPQLLKWLQESAKETYGQSISREAAAMLIELVGEDLAMLDTELAKLASYVGAEGKIDVGHVKTLVGGWRMETTWAMADAVRDDDLGFALSALDQLLTAGEAPMKLSGGINHVFKKFAVATDLARSSNLEQALRQAQVFPQAVGASQSYLRRLGRSKAEKILQKLLTTDMGLKGANPLPERVQLERLLIELAGR